MSKTRIYKSGLTYNLHGCQQSPRFINRINKVCQRINKLCQRIAQGGAEEAEGAALGAGPDGYWFFTSGRDESSNWKKIGYRDGIGRVIRKF